MMTEPLPQEDLIILDYSGLVAGAPVVIHLPVAGPRR
jgi:hypothetical protein